MPLDPGYVQAQIGRRTTQIRIRPATAEPMPTARRMLSGVASALFIARRIQAGLAANINPSITNRIPTPMRKSANAMCLIESEPPAGIFVFWRDEATVSLRPCQLPVTTVSAREATPQERPPPPTRRVRRSLGPP